MTSWRLLLTRPAEESASVAQALGVAGVSVVNLPLLEIEPLVVQPMPALDGYCAVIVVSKPAARLVLPALIAPQRQPWFSVGAATGEVLTASGLTVQWPADGEDSEALLRMPALHQALAAAAPRVLIVRGQGGRELMAEHLRRLGVQVDYLELYRRLLPRYPAKVLVDKIQAERLNGLVVSSGQGFAHLQALAAEDWPRLRGLPLFVPSARVAEQAREAGATNVVDCRGASAAALLAALQALPAPAP